MSVAHEDATIDAGTTVHTQDARVDPLASVPAAPEDPMFGLSAAYRNDNAPNKVDLGVGAYRDHNLQPYVLPSVARVVSVFTNDRLEQVLMLR